MRREKREKTQMTNIRNKIWENAINSTEIEIIIKGCYKEFYAHEFDNLDKIDTFLKRYKLSNSLEKIQPE